MKIALSPVAHVGSLLAKSWSLNLTGAVEIAFGLPCAIDYPQTINFARRRQQPLPMQAGATPGKAALPAGARNACARMSFIQCVRSDRLGRHLGQVPSLVPMASAREVVRGGRGTKSSGSSFSASEVNNGLTLHSTYAGSAKPVNTLRFPLPTPRPAKLRPRRHRASP